MMKKMMLLIAVIQIAALSACGKRNTGGNGYCTDRTNEERRGGYNNGRGGSAGYRGTHAG